MRIVHLEDGLSVEPETDFEEDYLRRFYQQQRLVIYLEHGISVKEVIGLRIVIKDEPKG